MDEEYMSVKIFI